MQYVVRVTTADGSVFTAPFEAGAAHDLGQGLLETTFHVAFDGISVSMTELSDTARGGCLLTPVLTCADNCPCEVRDFLVGFRADARSVDYFTSDWGCEFSPVHQDLSEAPECVLQVTAGRSSKQLDPWAGITLAEGAVGLAVGHGGNWRVEVSRTEEHVLAGLSGDFFGKCLRGGESFRGIRLALAGGEDLEAASLRLRGFVYRHVSLIGRQHWSEAPVVYNPWWPYEDRFINEGVCLRNAEAARSAGVTQFMLDAGWFGDARDTGAHMDWFEKRGDWDNVNLERFPHGMAALCREINSRGLKFGMWCEIEAIGAQARLRQTHPGFAAARDGSFLGYACLANPEAWRWARETVGRLIEEYGARWIKFDFNLDPGLGCDCEGHGHGRGDGLYEHYRGYYALLDDLHKCYPDVVLENCSSGGLRLDFETLAHTHFTHISDPDYVEHHFQVLWGALSYLPAACCYHFTQSQMRNPLDNDREPEPIRPDMPAHRFDYIIRACMVCNLGLSYRLEEFPDWCMERLRELVAFHRSTAIPYVYNGALHRLSGQPLRGGGGDRWQAFEFLADDGSALVYLFRLRGGTEARTVRLRGLQPGAEYDLAFQDRPAGNCMRSGAELMERGIPVDWLPEEGSEAILVTMK